jgi:raffinose/stachyose/melibiose transport system permease protein
LDSGVSSTLFNIKFRRIVLYFLIPVALYVFVLIIPLFSAFKYSMYNTLNYKLVWCGLDNYEKLFKDKLFWFSLKNNFIIMFVSIIFQIGPAFIIMAFVSANYVAGRKFVQSMFFFPCVISSLVTAYIWGVLYSNQFGIINNFLTAVGLPSQQWLTNPGIIMISICIPLAWQYIGFYLMILVSGLSGIDKDVLESAEIDGATGFRRTIHIILPLMKSTINIALLLAISGSIKVFDQIYALTMGGPGYASSVLAMYSYNLSFVENDYGYGTTVAIAMLVISLLIILIMNRVRNAVKQDD